MNNNNQKGQILLITLLILVVATTIALSIISRSTTDTTISRQVDESLRAFSAAEAGIEKSLQQGFAVTGVNNLADSSTSYSVSSAPLWTSRVDYTNVLPGDAASVWLVGHNTSTGLVDETNVFNGNLTICWNDRIAGGQVPAVEVILYHKITATGEFSAIRYAYDPATQNYFALPAANTTCGAGMSYQVSNIAMPAGSTPYLLRVKPLYDAADIRVIPTVPFPGQGNAYTSCGKIVTTDNKTVTQCISANQPYPAPASIFDNVLYTFAGVGKTIQ